MLDSYACCRKGGPSVLKFLYFFGSVKYFGIIIIIIIIIILYNSKHLFHEPKTVMPEWIYLVNSVSSSHILYWRCFII